MSCSLEKTCLTGEQETFVSKLHTLTTSDLEEFQHKFGEAMMLRVREEYEEEKHRDTLHYNHGSNELRESFEKSKIDRANEIAESTPTKDCLLYTSPSPRDVEESRMPSSA